MTPREFSDELAAFEVRRKDAMEFSVAQAWHTGQFMAQAFAGKLTPLDKVLARMATPAAATHPVNTDALVGAWSLATGIAARPISQEARRAIERMKES